VTTETRSISAVNGRVPNAPGPRGHPLLGVLPERRRLGDLRLWLGAWREYGDVVRARLGPIVVHLIVRPEHLRHVLAQRRQNYVKGIGYQPFRQLVGSGLLTSDGDFWQRQRRLMQPPFTPYGVRHFADAMVSVTDATRQRWRTVVGRPIDVRAEMQQLALSILGVTMFGDDLGRNSAQARAAIEFSMQFISHRGAHGLAMPLAVPLPNHRRFRSALQTLDAFIYRLIDERRRAPDATPDLLSILLQARDAETGATMTEQQLRDELMTMFIAGHETTAGVLSWTWYLLSKHADVEQRLHAELADVLGGRAPTLDDVPRLAFTRAILDEAMRLYPPVWVFPRSAVDDDEIGGYRIPRGSMLLLSPYITHRLPDLWDNPERFDPERFLPGRPPQPGFTFVPFGDGPRTCIGSHFAVLEMQLVLATLAQRYRMELTPGQLVEPLAVGVLRQRDPMLMIPLER
jgi:cytochrome P450